MKNIKPSTCSRPARRPIKTHLTKICLGSLIFILVGCGHSFITAPTDSEVKSTCYNSLVTITEAVSGEKVEGQPGQTISEDQAKAIIEVTGIEKGTPRVSGAKEVIVGIPDGTDLFPTRVTINFKAGGFTKKLDFYFYKNDHNEWILAPENQ
jgi:hypothetical protein